ncbi:MAG: hypothetical protein NWQ09_04295 [Nonlabens sp.]|nr:hypothetical protein [Nonlabens sp.]
MKRFLKILGKSLLFLLGFLLLAGIVLKIVFSEDVPQGTTGPKADELAYNILDAINNKEFTQVQEIHWTFAGKNRYRWKVQQNLVDVYWDDYRVAYQTYFPNISFAFKGSQRLEGEERDKAIAYAQKNFNNDSFWVVAPHKIFDAGTTRKLVVEDGKEQLLVTYNSGGTTPGDSYLWEVDENFKPVAFKMWTSIIPLDGVRATWSDWKMTSGGFPLAGSHSLYGIKIPVTEVSVVP